MGMAYRGFLKKAHSAQYENQNDNNNSLCVRKPTICMGENKDADQLRGNREADQRLCFRYTDSTFPPLLIPKFSRFWVSSVTVQAGLCWTWSETQIVGFVMHRLIYICKTVQTEFRDMQEESRRNQVFSRQRRREERF